jgi:hypothetical protein
MDVQPGSNYTVVTIAIGINGPWGLVLDKSEENLYVVGSTDNAIFKLAISANGISVSYPITVTSGNIIAGSLTS